MKYLAVANWLKYQHYGLSRKAPWIKVHLAILEKPEFVTMPDVARSHLLLLWLLALKLENKIPNNAAYVSKLICSQKAVDLQGFISSGWLVDYSVYEAELLAHNDKHASKVLAESDKPASKPSHDLRHESREKRVESNTNPVAPKAQRFDAKTQPVPDWLKEHWDMWCKHRKDMKKPVTESMAKVMVEDLCAMGEQRAKAAIRYTIGKGWQGLKEPEGSLTVSDASNGADRAWGIIVKRLHGTELAEGETLDTPEIQAAIKAMGGSKYLSSLDTNQLPYVKKDFIAAYNQASKQ